jgi:hypothetical protein
VDIRRDLPGFSRNGEWRADRTGECELFSLRLHHVVWATIAYSGWCATTSCGVTKTHHYLLCVGILSHGALFTGLPVFTER